MQSVYNWVDEITLSRPKKNISRDFSDGVLMAELMKHYYPRLVELHNYSAANSIVQKLNNWKTLNSKVFKKLGFQLSKKEIDEIINCLPERIEKILYFVKSKIEGKQNLDKMGSTQKDNISSKKNLNAAPRLDMEENDEKTRTMLELKETVEILELKIKKLEQLVKLKDSKIESMMNKLTQFIQN